MILLINAATARLSFMSLIRAWELHLRRVARRCCSAAYPALETSSDSSRKFAVLSRKQTSTLKLIGATVKSVIFGLIGTALAQGLLAALGFWIAGIERALLLGFFTFVLSFLPAGPPFVWGGVAIWLVVQGDFWWGMFVAAWGLLLVSTIDNLLRPYLLSQSNNLPVVPGLFGFVGSILAFEFIGIFVGPALLPWVTVSSWNGRTHKKRKLSRDDGRRYASGRSANRQSCCGPIKPGPGDQAGADAPTVRPASCLMLNFEHRFRRKF